MNKNDNENNQNKQQQPDYDNMSAEFESWHRMMVRRRKILKVTGIVLLCVVGIPVIVFGVCLIIMTGF